MDPEQTFIRVQERFSQMLTPKVRVTLEYLYLFIAITFFCILVVMHANYVQQPGCSGELSEVLTLEAQLIQIKITSAGLWSHNDSESNILDLPEIEAVKDSTEVSEVNQDESTFLGSKFLWNWIGSGARKGNLAFKFWKTDSEFLEHQAETSTSNQNPRPVVEDAVIKIDKEEPRSSFTLSAKETLKAAIIHFGKKWYRRISFIWRHTKQIIGSFQKLGDITGVHLNLDIPKWMHILHLDKVNSNAVQWLKKKTKLSEPTYLYTMEKGYFLLPESAKAQHNIRTVNVSISAWHSCLGNRWQQLLINRFVGYDTILINSLLSSPGQGYLYNYQSKEFFNLSFALEIPEVPDKFGAMTTPIPSTGSIPPSSSNDQSVASSAKQHKLSGDIGWKFNHLKDLNNKRRVTCDFCNETSTGGISRAKQHQLGIKGNVKACTQTPEDVKAILQEHEDKKLAAKKSMSGDVHEDDDEAARLLEISRIRSGKRPAEEGSMPAAKKNTKGPLDIIFYRKPEETLKKGKQTSLNDACDKQARASCLQYIARFFYRNGIAFNVANSKNFKLMVEAIGMYGAHLKPPSYHELRVPLLQDELRLTHEMLSTNKQEQAKYGCSIMSDGWTDTKGRTLINFLVNSPAGTMFVKSVDASAYMKTGQKVFELLDSFVEEIGESNVIQLVTDNGSNYVLAGKHLQVSRPKIFWTPCAAHCLDLMLEDIGKIPKVKKVIQKGMQLVGFIYNHSLVLNLMREKLESELVRSGVTRFATNFLTLHRLHTLKAKIRTMFTSEEWLNLNASKEVKGKKAAAIVLQVSFWEDVVYTLKAMGPLVKVLRLVDNEKKPAMGNIYHAMLEAKELITKNFNNNESKYKDIIAIVDRRWSIQLHHPLHAAGYYLNPRFFYSNPMIENDDKLLDGLYACINKLSESDKVVDAIHGELSKYRMGVGHFALTEAVRQRNDVAPDYLVTKCGVLMMSLFVFFTTTMSVSFTLRETQTRMLKFTVQLQHHARHHLPTFQLIFVHVIESLVFVPIMIGILFFLFEFYDDQLLAFMVLILVWLCELFTLISVRTPISMKFFPRFFLLYFLVFHIYFFSYAYGFSYLALSTTAAFMTHLILYFWNRFEVPALQRFVQNRRSQLQQHPDFHITSSTILASTLHITRLNTRNQGVNATNLPPSGTGFRPGFDQSMPQNGPGVTEPQGPSESNPAHIPEQAERGPNPGSMNFSSMLLWILGGASSEGLSSFLSMFRDARDQGQVYTEAPRHDNRENQESDRQ